MSSPAKKMEQLCRRLKETGGVLVAFSGGVDSTFLLKAAREVLGEKVLAVTAVSETYPETERRAARRLARSFGVEHLEIGTDEWRDPHFRANPPSRCYHCKKHLFRALAGLASERGLVLVDATNYSDRLDYRPGDRAARLYRVRRPLLEAGLTKDDIRLLSRRLKLPTADKPAAACLASRIPYGTGLTRPRLRAVAEGEACLRRLGLGETSACAITVRWPASRSTRPLLNAPCVTAGPSAVRSPGSDSGTSPWTWRVTRPAVLTAA